MNDKILNLQKEYARLLIENVSNELNLVSRAEKAYVAKKAMVVAARHTDAELLECLIACEVFSANKDKH